MNDTTPTDSAQGQGAGQQASLEESLDAGRHSMLDLLDLVNARHHSADFIGSRAEYVQQRLRMLALLFAVLVPLWIPLDYLLLNGDGFAELVVARVATSIAFLTVALWRPYPYHVGVARLRLGMLVLIPCLFYLVACVLLVDDGSPWALMSYSFYPFVIVTQLAIFPLTLLEGLLLALPVFVTVLATQFALDALGSSATVESLWLLALLTSLALWAQVNQLQMLLRLYRQATRDALTGLFNRRALMTRLDVEIERSNRYRRELSVLLFDLDKFKRINDTLGHLAGDAVLRHFSGVVEQALRRTDLVGRYGGEEFLAVLPETGSVRAQEVAERIRAGCHASPASGPSGEPIEFTTSIGVAQLAPDEEAEQLLSRVDDSLYKAKESGRDRVILAR
ncbi:MAG TPA: GGDEF domain-containing protein [Gammaproteobacteria bacterium]